MLDFVYYVRGQILRSITSVIRHRSRDITARARDKVGKETEILEGVLQGDIFGVYLGSGA